MPATATKPTEKTWDINDLFAKRVRRVEIPIGRGATETFWVGYSPDAFSPKVFAEFKGAMAGAGDDDTGQVAEDVMAEMSVKLIRSWSLTVGGEPFEVSVDNFKRLGIALMGEMFEAVNTDYARTIDAGKVLSESPQDSNGT